MRIWHLTEKIQGAVNGCRWHHLIRTTHLWVEFTQGFWGNYLASQTDRLEVSLSIISSTRHRLLPCLGISEMFFLQTRPRTWPTQVDERCVLRWRNQPEKRPAPPFPSLCARGINTALRFLEPLLVFCLVSWPNLHSRSKTHLPPDQSIFLTASAFQILPFLPPTIISLRCQDSWHWPIKSVARTQFFKSCPKQIGLNLAISTSFASRNRKLTVGATTWADSIE